MIWKDRNWFLRPKVFHRRVKKGTVAKENIPAQKLYRKTGFVFCGEADMYGHSYFLCERILTNGLDEIKMHLTGIFPQVTG